MNKEESQQARAVMEAWENGAKIQIRRRHTMAVGNWEPESHLDRMDWDWYNYDYRIKPEPMEIEVWVRPNGERAGIVEPADDSAIRKGVELGWTKKKFREVLD